MIGSHSRIIANAAKGTLGPLGFKQKGRSRVWLADHGWWLAAVEFQPSGWSKGSYLNVAAHWLWVEQDHLSFDYGGRVGQYEEYDSDAQFVPGASRLAAAAAHEAQRLADLFRSTKAAAALLLQHESKLPERGRGSWSAYHAGIAAGLSGMMREAAAMLRSVTDDRVKLAAARMAALLGDTEQFASEAASIMSRHRATIGLD